MSDFEEYYPAPKADDIGMLSGGEETADPVMHREAAELFIKGNLALRNREFEAAAAHLAKAAALLPENGEIAVNYAVALQHLDRAGEAIGVLRQITLGHPQLELGHALLGFLYGKTGDWNGAIAALERGLRFHPESAKLLLALGEASVGAGDTAKAEVFFSRAIETDPAFSPPRFRLGKILFQRGKALFTAAEFDEAFGTWSRAYRTASDIFSIDPEIASELRKLRTSFVQNEGLGAALTKYTERFRDDRNDPRALFDLFNVFLFTAGLIPECHERFEGLDEAEARWNGDLVHFGEHPYAHFRLALIGAVKGKFDTARKELQWCQDKLPPMKREMLRLQRILDFISKIEEVRRSVDDQRVSGASSDVWENAGFTDPFQLRAWKETGLEPSAAAEWRAAGFSPKQAASWFRAKLAPGDAAKWLKDGFSDPKEARQWIRGGLTPDEAKAWRDDFPRSAEEAIQWRRTGFTSAQQARQWLQVFSFPWAASQWRDLGFEPFEALSWSESGFRDPFLAASWKKRGFSPAEALVEFGNAEAGEGEEIEEEGKEEE